MSLPLRHAGLDDYDVIQDGEIVGRIYRMKADRELWRWTIRLWAPRPAQAAGYLPPSTRRWRPSREVGRAGLIGIAATTLDEAKAAFRAAGDRNCTACKVNPPSTEFRAPPG